VGGRTKPGHGDILKSLNGSGGTRSRGERPPLVEDGVFMIAETWYHLFRDGLMAAESFYYDLASLLKQIGALPKKDVQWR
jgi:hypothetical protein